MSYLTDLSDQQWARVAYHFQDYPGHCRPRKYDYRDILNAIFYISRSGCQWRLLPRDYPPWQSVYYYYRKWQRDGTWDQVHQTLRQQVRESAGKQPTPTLALVDSQSVKTVQKGGSGVMTPGRKLKDGNGI
ncbi:MAG: IS5 family transposase [Thiolinea sp.]